jgi:hypothetical protein
MDLILSNYKYKSITTPHEKCKYPYHLGNSKVINMDLYEIKRKIIWLVVEDQKKLASRERILSILIVILFVEINLLILNLGKIMPFPYSIIYIISYSIIPITIFYYFHNNKEKLKEKYNLKHFSS